MPSAAVTVVRSEIRSWMLRWFGNVNVRCGGGVEEAGTEELGVGEAGRDSEDTDDDDAK